MKKEKNKIDSSSDNIDIDDITHFMSLSTSKKIDFLEEFYEFINRTMTPEKMEIYEKLREMGL